MNEYNLAKNDQRKRLPNIDVEMGSVKENRGTEADTLLNDTDDIDAALLSEKQFADEDEQTNNFDTKKTPCSEFVNFTLEPTKLVSLV